MLLTTDFLLVVGLMAMAAGVDGRGIGQDGRDGRESGWRVIETGSTNPWTKPVPAPPAPPAFHVQLVPDAGPYCLNGVPGFPLIVDECVNSPQFIQKSYKNFDMMVYGPNSTYCWEVVSVLYDHFVYMNACNETNPSQQFQVSNLSGEILEFKSNDLELCVGVNYVYMDNVAVDKLPISMISCSNTNPDVADINAQFQLI